MIEAYRHVTIILEKPEVDPLEKQITSLRVAYDAAQGQARQVDLDLFANLLGASTATFWQHLMVATSTKPAFDAVREASLQHNESQAAGALLGEVKSSVNAPRELNAQQE